MNLKATKSICNRVLYKINNQFIASLVYILSVHILIFLFFCIFRFILSFVTLPYIEEVDGVNITQLVLKAYIKGLRFDNMVISYIMLAPLFILPAFALVNRFGKRAIQIANGYFIICCLLAFAILVADIPYFSYFNNHLNLSALQWMEYPDQTIGMILEDNTFLLYFLLYIVSFIIFIFLLIKLRKIVLKYFRQETIFPRATIAYVSVWIIAFLLCFVGTRGFVFTKRLGMEAIYFTGISVIDHMVPNPIFFMTQFPSYHQMLNQVGPEKVIEVVNCYQNFDIRDSLYFRNTNDKDGDNPNRPNIVLVFVESFSSDYLNYKDKEGKELLPFMNQLIRKSYYFDKFFSQGTHTNQGIVASLYGFPSIFNKVMTIKLPVNLEIDMFEDEKFSDIRKETPFLYGMPNELKDSGYNNIFFVNHTKTFDNLDNFLAVNGFDSFYGSEDYPESEYVNTWGVSDDYLLGYALSKMDSVSQTNTPFFTSIVTISNHPPYAYPAEYDEVSPNEDECAMAYADNCFKKFMELAATKDWYNNSIFLFLGDHGKRLNTKYSLPLSMNHVPLIIYSPLFENMPQRKSVLAGQIDLYPTLMGLMGWTSSYKTFGIDVLKEARPYIYFSSDNALASYDGEHYYVYDFVYNTEFLYQLTDGSDMNYIDSYRHLADSMKTYSSSMLQGADYIFKNHK